MKDNTKQLNKKTKVNAYKYGKVLEMTNSGTSHKATIIPLSKKEFVQVATGEIKQFSKNNGLRVQSPQNLKKTFRKLRRIILANFSGGDIWLTLTYSQEDKLPVTDTKRVYKDFKAFWRRFITKYGSCDYL